MNISKLFKDNMKTLMVASSFLFAMGTGFAQEKKQDNKAKNDTITTVKPVLNKAGKVIGKEVKGRYESPTTVEKVGDTTITRSKTIDFREMNAADSEKLKTQKAQEPSKAARVQSYKERWEQWQKDNKATDAQLREAQAKENELWKKYLATKKAKEQEALLKSTEQEKEKIIRELVIKEVEKTVEVPVFQKRPIPFVKKNLSSLTFGPVNEQIEPENHDVYESLGAFAHYDSPTVLNGWVNIGANVQVHPGKTIYNVGVEAEKDCGCAENIPVILNKAKSPYINAQALVEVGKEFNLFGTKVELPEMFDTKKTHIRKGGVNVRPFIAGGVGYEGLGNKAEIATVMTDFDYPTLLVDDNIPLTTSQKNSFQEFNITAGAGIELNIPLSKQRRVVETTSGEEISWEQATEMYANYQENAQELSGGAKAIVKPAVVSFQIGASAFKRRHTPSFRSVEGFDVAQSPDGFAPAYDAIPAYPAGKAFNQNDIRKTIYAGLRISF